MTFPATRTLLLMVAALVAAPVVVAPVVVAAPVRVSHVEAELLSEAAAIQGGQPFTVALRLAMDEHWHTYWKNAGDSGMPTTIEWKLPPGFSAGEIQWPVPTIVPTPPLISYGYDGEVLLLVEIKPPANLPAGAPVTLNAKATWLVCKEECIPGETELSLSLPVEASTRVDATNEPKFAAARARLPIDARDSWRASFAAAGDKILLSITPPKNVTPDPTDAYFYTETADAVSAGAKQTSTLDDGRLVLTLTKSEYAEKPPATLAGVLTAKGATPSDRPQSGIALVAEPGADAAPAVVSKSLLGLLLPAFLGGLILNLMPCVFPVLGIKIMGFVNQAGADRRKVTLHGLVFTVGVLLSFWALAGALIALKAGGAELGWGFQLQEPLFVFGLAVFLLAFALNLSGVFEFGLAATSVGGSLQMKSGYSGSFFSGVLATIVSTPCAAPFLAGALGAAVTLPATQSLTLFTVIALGLAAPYLVMSAFPRLVKILPRPGAWMETFKQLMAFPLYATVAYLVYVLAGQLEKKDDLLFNALGGMTLVALALWGYGRWAQNGAAGKRLWFGRAFAVVGLAVGIAWGLPRGGMEWVEWKPGLPEQLRDEGKIVYVDFTARWCATCQVNKRVVFGSDAVNNAFARHKVVRVKADWTNRDSEITRALAAFERSAVPVNLIYAPRLDTPILLPSALTPGIVLDALQEATGDKSGGAGS